jgi:hypothetical protein
MRRLSIWLLPLLLLGGAETIGAGAAPSIEGVQPEHPVGAAPDPPAETSSSLRDLDFFAGRWTIEGSEDTYLEVCDWRPMGAYLTCRGEDTSEDPPGVSLSLIGYSVAEEAFTHTGFGSAPRVLRGWRHDDVWVFVGHRERGTVVTRWQVTITPTERGFHFRQETSNNGAPWATSVEIQYVRLPRS